VSTLPPFHLAFPVGDLSDARRFYLDTLGCTEGRSADDWVDFNFYGHQIVAHLEPGYSGNVAANEVDGDAVPVRHFGIVLGMEQWHTLAEKLKSSDVEFIIEPHVRFEGKPGEQATMFIRDPSGNALEFKAFADMSQLFKK
jgi:extradiol dioxygenase family protein